MIDQSLVVYKDMTWVGAPINLFVAVGGYSAGFGQIATSADGLTWNLVTLSTDTTPFTSVAYSPTVGLFVAVEESGIIWTSPDASSWTERLPAETQINLPDASPTRRTNRVIWCDNEFMLVSGGQSNSVYQSENGINWTPISKAASISEFADIAYKALNDVYLAVSFTGGNTSTASIQYIGNPTPATPTPTATLAISPTPTVTPQSTLPLVSLNEFVATGNDFSLPVQEATSMFFKPDGTKVFLTSATADQYFAIDLGTPWDVSTASYNGEFFTDVALTNPYSISISPDGINVIGFDAGNFFVQGTMSTPWDISTMTVDVTRTLASFAPLFDNVSGWHAMVNPTNGTELFLSGEALMGSGAFTRRYVMSTPWDIESLTLNETQATIELYASFIDANGKSWYGVENDGDGIQSFDDVIKYTSTDFWDLQSFTPSVGENIDISGFFYALPVGGLNVDAGDYSGVLILGIRDPSFSNMRLVEYKPTPTPTVTPSPTQGTVSTGYVAGGFDDSTVRAFPMIAPFTNSTNIGDLAGAYQYGLGGHQSLSDAYASGGADAGGYLSKVDRFPLASPFTTVTQVGDIADGGGNTEMAYHFSASSPTDGHLQGGYSGSGFFNLGYVFPFASPFAGDIALNTGDANVSFGATVQTKADFYAAGAYESGSGAVSIIQRYPFTSPWFIFAGIGNLSSGRWGGSGTQSPSTGFVAAGSPNGGFGSSTVVDSFPFAAPFTTATIVGNLTGDPRRYAAGVSSPSDGFAVSSSPASVPALALNRTDRFPFAAPFGSTVDVGDINPSPTSTGVETNGTWEG